VRRREFLKLTAIGLLTSGCATGGSTVFKTSLPSPFEEAKIKKLFKTSDPITQKYLEAYNKTIKGLDELVKEYQEKGFITLERFGELYSAPLFQLFQLFIYIAVLKQNGKISVKVENGTYILPPGARFIYEQKGFCMNKNYPAPHTGDKVRLEPLSKTHLPPEVLKTLQCIVINKDKVRNPQGIVWFLVEFENVTYSDLLNKYSHILNEIEKVCPGSREKLLALKRKQIPKQVLKGLLREFKFRLGSQTFTLDQLFFEPESTQTLLNRLIEEGKRTGGPKGPGYSRLNENLYAKAITTNTLRGRAEVLNYGFQGEPFNPLNYYFQPAAKKQRISPVGTLAEEKIVIPTPAREFTFYQSVICKVVEKAYEKLGKIFKDKADKVIEKFADIILKRDGSLLEKLVGKKVLKFIAFVLKQNPIAKGVSAYEALCGKSFLICKPLSCHDRALSLAALFPPVIEKVLTEFLTFKQPKLTEKIKELVELIKEVEEHYPLKLGSIGQKILQIIENCDSLSEEFTMPVCKYTCVSNWIKVDPFKKETDLKDIVTNCLELQDLHR